MGLSTEKFQNSKFFQQASQNEVISSARFGRECNIQQPPTAQNLSNIKNVWAPQNPWNFGILESCSTTTTTTITIYIYMYYIFQCFLIPPQHKVLHLVHFCDSKIYSRFQAHFTNNPFSPHFPFQHTVSELWITDRKMV